VIPGVGFSVVPLDCLAVRVVRELSQPQKLELAFDGYELSVGTANTYIEGLANGTAYRESGLLRKTRFKLKFKEIPFFDHSSEAVLVRYGELVTCYKSTGVPNITVHMVPPRRLIPILRSAALGGFLLRFNLVQRLTKLFLAARFRGPDADMLRNGRSRVWARASDSSGLQKEAFTVTPEPYRFSVDAALKAVQKILCRDSFPAGAFSPAEAFGWQFIEELGLKVAIR
jgi:short subunit dehydrogenase-like uncharacterized protein